MPYRNPVTGQTVAPHFTVPAVFREGLSYQDQILLLASKLQETIDTSISRDELEATEALVAAQDAKIAAQDQEIRDLAAYVRELEEQIDAISREQRVYDVTQGAYTDSKRAMRRLYQYLSYAHYPAQECLVSSVALRTVSAVAGVTCYQLAWGDKVPADFPDQTPSSAIDSARLDAGTEYVKVSDMKPINARNLSEQICGYVRSV